MSRLMLKKCICALGFLCGCILADEKRDLPGVHAYPVPFNPKKSSAKAITIDFSSASLSVPCQIKMSVYDINGDSVCSRSFSFSKPDELNGLVKWNGRNDSGKLVGQGLYIIRLEVEESSGAYSEKNIRVVIVY